MNGFGGDDDDDEEERGVDGGVGWFTCRVLISWFLPQLGY